MHDGEHSEPVARDAIQDAIAKSRKQSASYARADHEARVGELINAVQRGLNLARELVTEPRGLRVVVLHGSLKLREGSFVEGDEQPRLGLTVQAEECEHVSCRDLPSSSGLELREPALRSIVPGLLKERVVLKASDQRLGETGAVFAG